jgi:hypothetical protein
VTLALPDRTTRARLGLAFLFATVTIIVCCNRGFNADKAPSPGLRDGTRAATETNPNQASPSDNGTAPPSTTPVATPTPEPTEVIIDEKLYEQGVQGK